MTVSVSSILSNKNVSHLYLILNERDVHINASIIMIE